MSRGPGRIQRTILDAVADGQWQEARSLLPIGWKHTDESALSRAIWKLAGAGKIAAALIDTHGRGDRLAFGPAGTTPAGYVCALVQPTRRVTWYRAHSAGCHCGGLVHVWIRENGQFTGWERIPSPGLPKCGDGANSNTSTLSQAAP